MAADGDIDQIAAIGRLPGDCCIRQGLPMGRPHRMIEAGKHHGPLRKPGHGGNQPGGRRPGAGRSGDDDRTVSRRGCEAAGKDIQHRIVVPGRA